MVWYVSYGSNLDPLAGWGTYLGGGTPDGGHFTYRGARDPSPPRARRPCRVPHDLYFAGESRTWGGGIAFLDHEHVSPAPTLGHAYLVTAEQFEDVAAQETGREHAEVEVAEVRAAGSVTLGMGAATTVVWLGDVDDVPQLTFTSPNPRRRRNRPRRDRWICTASRRPGGGSWHDADRVGRLPSPVTRRRRALVDRGVDHPGLGRPGIVPTGTRLCPQTREDTS